MRIIKFLIISSLLCTFILINLGGLVHNTGSSLACPDWPLCYGQVMPEMTGGILIEHSHRLLATLVGFLGILILVFSIKKYGWSDRFTKLSFISLVVVILQGILGGITVIYQLPAIVSTVHLSVSMIFFASLIYLLHLDGLKFQSNETSQPDQNLKWNKNYKDIFLLLMIGVYFQIVIGASMRHLGLGGVCGYGWDNAAQCLDLLGDSKGWWPVSSQAKLHMIHRLWGVLIGTLTIAAMIYFFIIHSTNKIIKSSRFYILSLPLIVLTQIFIGLYMVATELAILPTTVHLGLAALLFGFLWKIYLNVSSEENKFYPSTPTILSDLLSLTKPRLSALVVFTAGVGMYLAPVVHDFSKVVWGLIAIVLIVAGACALNCLLEKDIDKKMTRTSMRPLPNGRLSPGVALFFGLFLIIISTFILFFKINSLTAILGMIATLVYILSYTPMKQKSANAVLVGAIPGAIPPLMGWTSMTNNLDMDGIYLFLILFIWQLPHFLSIAIYYAQDYKSAGLVVMPNTKGLLATKFQIVLYTLFLISLPFMMNNFSGSTTYMVLNLIAGFTLLFVALMGISKAKVSVDEHTKNWSRKYFWGSLIYLPSLLLIIIFFR